jgi:CheY-like chemotaxis protein
MKVLVVEDDALSRWYLNNVLADWGYEVTACENGSQGWKAFTNEEYQLVISDWAMPEMDGIELCRRLRAAEPSDGCYFILLSSKVGKGGFVQETEAGVDVYLSKPVDRDQLKYHLKVAEFLLRLRSECETTGRLLPMCAWCRKARIDEDIWFDVQDAIAESRFTYSICPECSTHLKVTRLGCAAK